MKLISSLLSSSLFLGALSTVSAAEVVGRADLTYTHLYAVGLPGSPRYEEYDDLCKERLGTLLNTRGWVDYNVNTVTGIHVAYFNYMGSRSRMSSLGLSNVYGFIGSVSGAPTLLNIGVRNVFFTIDRAFESTTSLFTFNSPKEDSPDHPEFQCILSTHAF